MQQLLSRTKHLLLCLAGVKVTLTCRINLLQGPLAGVWSRHRGCAAYPCISLVGTVEAWGVLQVLHCMAVAHPLLQVLDGIAWVVNEARHFL
jgi:hypothetical protein